MIPYFLKRLGRQGDGMKIHRTAGPNKGQRRDSWVVVNRRTGAPAMFGRGLLVFACRRDAAEMSGWMSVKFRYEHLKAAYNINRRKKSGRSRMSTYLGNSIASTTRVLAVRANSVLPS